MRAFCKVPTPFSTARSSGLYGLFLPLTGLPVHPFRYSCQWHKQCLMPMLLNCLTTKVTAAFCTALSKPESIPLRKYRIIERFSSGGNFSRLRTAKIEGYLAGNRDFCRHQAAEIHPLMGREHCAVVP